MSKWKKAFSTETPYKAEIVKDILENRGLSPILVNKKEYVSHMGYCEVLVSQEELLLALKIIDDEIEFK